MRSSWIHTAGLVLLWIASPSPACPGCPREASVESCTSEKARQVKGKETAADPLHTANGS